MSSKGSKTRKGALGMALAAALTFLSRPSQQWVFYSLCALLFITIFYGLSGWATKKRLSFAETMGRTVILLCVVSCAVAIYAWQFRPGWHLTAEQEDGLSDAAKHIPKDVYILVELPENNIAGKGYGKEIMQVLKHNGANVNSITIFKGVGETPVGLVVSARFRGEPGFEAASYVHSKMLSLEIPATFQAGNNWSADASSFVIYVGSRPPD